MNASLLKRQSAARLPVADLRRRWQRMLDDPLLRDIPGKLELNEKGAIEVSRANTRHGFLQAFIAGELRRLRPEGATITECPIETEIGIRVPDIAWASPEFTTLHGMTSPLPRAPELCIEVVSASNTAIELSEKRAAYLAAGAREVWLVAEDGTIQIFGERGPLEASVLGIALVLPH